MYGTLSMYRALRRGKVSCVVGGGRILGVGASTSEGFLYQREDDAAIFGYGFEPGEAAHLWEIDAAETEARDKDVYAESQGLVSDRRHSVCDCLRAVGFSPTMLYFGVGFVDGHLERSVGHGKGDELLPVLRARQSPGCLQPFVKGRGGQRGEQAEDGQAWRPGANLLQRSVCDTHGVVVHAEDEGSDGEDVALGEALEDGGVLAGLVETFVDVFEVGGVDGLHADEDPFATGGGDEVDELFVAEQISADLRDPVDLGVGGDDVAQERFGALDVDGEIVVDEEDGDLAALAPGAGFEEQEFVDHTFVGAKADAVTEETGDGAKFTAIRAAAAGLDRNDAECAPAGADFLEHGIKHLWNNVELCEIDGVPRDGRIGLQGRLL